MWGRASKSAPVLEAKLELLQEENERLRQQVKELQEALVASTAPAAYQQRIATRWAEEEKNDPEVVDRKEETKFMEQYVGEMEGATFKNPDEFVSYLSRGGNRTLQDKLETAVTMAPPTAVSLHGNSES